MKVGSSGLDSRIQIARLEKFFVDIGSENFNV